jgi:hypothetical protein
MHGQITKYRDDIDFGVIEAENGRKFRFVKSQIVNAGEGLVGHSVDFVLVASRPTEIIMMTGSPWTVFGSADRT